VFVSATCGRTPNASSLGTMSPAGPSILYISHTAESHGRVAKLLAADSYGFIETADGREIYFHRNGAYRRLRVGSEVRFVERKGRTSEHGSPDRQASPRIEGAQHAVS